jgi:hypothetical protein
MQDKITNKNIAISLAIEELHLSKNLNYLDSIILWCDQNDMELEEIASIIKKDPVLKEKLQKEGEGSHLLKTNLTANSLLI